MPDLTSPAFQISAWCLLAAGAGALVMRKVERRRAAKRRAEEAEKLRQRKARILAREQKAAAKKIRLEAGWNNLRLQREELEAQKSLWQDEVATAREWQEFFVWHELRGAPPRVGGRQIMLMDPRSGQVLMERNADLQQQVASTQKLLTALLVVEGGALERQIVLASEDLQESASRIGLKAGDACTRHDLLLALLLESSNESAQALARDQTGSVEAFVTRMNQRAAALGMVNSRFSNPAGMPHKEQYSTARDLMRLAGAVDAAPLIRKMVRLLSATLTKTDGTSLELRNTNALLGTFPPCDGMKTGFTRAAGHCLISTAESHGQRRILVILNDTQEGIWKDSEALLTWSLRG